ncbi:MAG: hypothetical protein JXA89_22880, partial [Anaerolineae bacterium]|nr:hypothetical protein [Anaerolineae bacterium]
MLKLFLLGAPRVERDGIQVSFDRRKAMALLAYLAVTGQPHRRDVLAALLWPAFDQSRARTALRRTVFALKQGIGEVCLDADREMVHLVPGVSLWTDVGHFRDLVASCRGHDHRADELCSACLDVLSEAAVLCGGGFMAGFSLRDSEGFDDWQRDQGEVWHRELIAVLDKLARGYGSQHEYALGIACAQRWLSIDPLDELAHCRLMQLYSQSNQRASALQQYQMCRDMLEREFGVSPSDETNQVYRGIYAHHGSPVETPIPRSLGLPAQATPFIGRKDELDEISRQLANPECRLLTLVGPGGIGKTRLALQAAADAAHQFMHGVHFVPLASIPSVDLVIPAIAERFDPISGELRGQNRSLQNAGNGVDLTLKEQLWDYLWAKEMLLVLDNVEHLIGAVDLLGEMLSAAPGLKLVVTSRQRLNIQGEWLFEVQGMSVPGEEQACAQVASFDAVRLFLSAARRVAPRFPAEPRDLARICRSLDGVPLAIELAATWARAWSCAEIAQAANSSTLDLPSTSLRGVPERHRSMRAVFEHS